MWFEAKSAGGKVFRVNVKESGVRFNYSQMTHTSGQAGFYWDVMQGHTEKFYSGFGNNYNWVCPVPAIEALIKFPIGDNNCITMSANPDEQFYGTSGTADIGNGAVMSTSEGSNFLFSFFTVTQDSTSYAYCGGIFRANPYGYSGQSQVGFNSYPSSDRFVYETDETKIPAMSFWLLTMHDDVQSSTTYGQDFDVIMVAVRGGVYGGGESHPNTYCLFDARMFKGASNLTPTKSTTRGNSPTGWTGSRSDKSDSDTESHIGTAITGFANNFEYGTHVYKLSAAQLQGFYRYLWSNNTWDSAAREKNNPIRGIISLHLLPVTSTVRANQPIHLCGRKAVTFNTLGTEFTEVQGDESIDTHGEFITKIFHPEHYTDSFLDWGNNTIILFRLPFVGIVPIDTNKIMDGGIYAKYNIDYITGNCLVQIYTIPNKYVMGTENDWDITYDGCLCMIGQYSGNCAHKFNVSTCDYGGATAIGSIVNTVLSAGTMAVGAMTGNPMLMMGGAFAGVRSEMNYYLRNEEMSVIGATPNSDTMGMMKAALIIDRPIDVTPLDENGDATIRKYFMGIPAAGGGKVKDYKVGYEDSEVYIRGVLHADTLYATEREKKEIESAFAKGVYI